MVKLLLLKMLRDLKKSAGTYIVCVFIIAIGFTGYSVLSILDGQLRSARDTFYEQASFADVFADVHEAPSSAVRSLMDIEGVERAQGRIIKTVRVSGCDGGEPELRLMSYEDEGLNLPLLSGGSLPSKGMRELAAGNGFCEARGLKNGDTLSFIVSGATHEYSITGVGMTPETIYLVKSIMDMIPNPSMYDAGFMRLDEMERLFAMPGRANNFVLTLSHGYSLEDVEDEIKRILKPYGVYGVYDRTGELSCSVLDMEVEQIGRMSGAIPFLFLGISAIILYISLSRLIEQQRVQIGTLLAVGIEPRVIGAHYTAYGAVTGLIGGIIGGILGNLSAGPMFIYFQTYFNLPDAPAQFSVGAIISGALMAGVFCSGIGFLTARSATKLQPAEAMRPAPPKSARKSVVERIPFVMNLFTVPGIMAVRGLTRNRRRSLLSIFGIACAYMITATLVSMSSMFDIFIFDYIEKNQRQDLTVAFDAPVLQRDALAAVHDPSVERAEGVVEVAAAIRGLTGELDCMIEGIPPDSTMRKLYDEKDNPVYVSDSGVVLSRHMADLIGADKGSYIEIEVIYPRSRVSTVMVTDIFAQYAGSTAYMTHSGVGAISGYRNTYTSVLLRAPLEARDSLMTRLESAERVVGIKSRQEVVDQYRGMMGSMTGIMSGMAFMGIIVGVAVIYVSSLISFEELKREIATMMMLGLSAGQCLDVISVGQSILTLFSFALGIPMTFGVGYMMTTVIAGELFSIPTSYITVGSLALSAALTFVSVALSSAVMYRKLKKLTPVDLLRERE